jgi:UPF0716 protein FxsA
MRPLFSLFVLFPLIELILLILLGSAIGAGPLILWVLLTAVLGVAVMRRAGWQAWRQADWRMQRGESPARELTDGALVSVGGFLLILPGPITDILGLLCLLPFSRRWLAGHYRGMPGSAPPGRPAGDGSVTLEGEFRREADTPAQQSRDQSRRLP